MASLAFCKPFSVGLLEKGLAKRDCAFENSPEVLFSKRPVVLKRFLHNQRLTSEFYFPPCLVEVLSDPTLVF